MKFSRYLVWNFIKMFLLVMIGAIVIFIVIDFVGNIKTWLAHDMKNVGEYYLNYLPYIIYLVMPVGLFIAVIASVGNMAKYLEITAIQSSGRSPLRILMPVFLVGLVSVGVSFWLSDYILPDANHRRLEIMEMRAQRHKNPRIRDKNDFTFINNDRISWFFNFYSGKQKIGRNVVLLIRDRGDLVERYDARIIRWVEPKRKKPYWQLERGYHRFFNKDGSVTIVPFGRLILGNKVPTLPNDLINERQTGDEMDSKMILHRIEVLKRSGEDTRALETSYYFKLSGSWMNLIVLLIGAALCHRFSRSGGLSQKFGIGIFLVFSYYILIRFGLKLGENGALSPVFAAWFGHVFFAIVANFMLYRSFRL